MTETNNPYGLLEELTAAPSPSGYEQPAQEVFRRHCGTFADEVTTDVIGNVYAVLKSESDIRVMLAGHMDEIGFLVTHATSAGFIYFEQVGGQDATIVVGQRVLVHTSEHGSVAGVVGKKPIHLLTAEERGKKTEINELYVDIGAQTGVDVGAMVAIGDPITYATQFQRLLGDLATSHGFDNKTGAFVVAETVRIIKERGGHSVNVYGVSTVQEELGQRGARAASDRIRAQVGIAVDVTHATDCPGIDKRQVGDIKLGGGPVITRGANVNPEVYQRLINAAIAEGVAVQLNARGSATRTDAGIMQVSGGGMATGVIGIPLRYMHSACEVVSLLDVDAAARLLARFVIDIEADADFTPSISNAGATPQPKLEGSK